MLSPGQVAEYHQKGYTVQPGFLSPEAVKEILAEVGRIIGGSTLADHDESRMEMEPKQPPEGTMVRRLYEPCTHYPLFRELSESEKLGDALEQLLGSDLMFHYSKINMKPSEIGSVVEWHQDLPYYPLTNRDSLAVLFYLDDADRDNGCLQVLPGRHQGPVLGHMRNGYFQGKVVDEMDASEATLVEGKAGSAIFMHCMTPHASIANRSQRDRRTLILSYRAADAYPLYHGEMTLRIESNARLVRGERAPTARFTMKEFPIPLLKGKSSSLYKLQERSRAGEIR